MGWASGSYIAERIWKNIKPYILEDKRKLVAKKLYDIFCENDADDWEFEKENLYWTYLKYYEKDTFKQLEEEMEA